MILSGDVDQIAAIEDGFYEDDESFIDEDFHHWHWDTLRRLQIVEESLSATPDITGTFVGNIVVDKSFTGTGDATGPFIGNVDFSSIAFDGTGAITLTLANTIVSDASFTGTGALTDSMAANLVVYATMQDTASISTLFAAAAQIFDVWALTLDAHAEGNSYPAYKYTNFNFNGFANVAGRVYASGEDGLFELTGSTDDGSAIESFFRMGDVNLGSDRDKRIVDGYLIGTSAEQMTIEIYDIENEDTYEYEIDKEVGTSTRRQKFKMGRGLSNGFYELAVFNQIGADFDISDIMLRPIILKRRRK